MFCSKCGSDISDGSMFCTNCGTKVEDSNPTVYDTTFVEPKASMNFRNEIKHEEVRYEKKKERKKVSKVKVIFSLLLVVFVLASGFIAYRYLNSSVRDMSKYISDENYSEAVELYNDKLKDKWLEKLIADKILTNVVNNTYEEFENSNLSYDQSNEILEELSFLRETKITSIVDEKITLLEKSYENITTVAEAEQDFENGDYLGAIDKYEQIDKESQDYEVVAQKIEEAKKRYKEEVLAQSKSPESKQDYVDYISLITTALSVLPDDAELTARKETLQSAYKEEVKSETLTSVGDFVKNDQYENAIELINETLDIVETDADLENLLTSTKDSYIKYATTESKSMVKQGDYDDAIELLKTAISVLVSNDELSALLSEFEDSKPMNLSDLTIGESDNVSQLEDRDIIKDTVGNIYDPGNLFSFLPYYGEAYIKINLDKKYTRLAFDMAVSIERPDDKNTVILSAFGDDNQLLYSQEDISRSTSPKNVEVDVTGVDWLYISVKGYTYHNVCILVSEAKLYK